MCEESTLLVKSTPNSPCGSNWGHEIVDFVFLPYIAFTIVFTALECIKRYSETICAESL